MRVGERAEQVIRSLGPPDRAEPGARAGDGVLVYGALRLQIRSGRVAGISP